MERKSKLYTKLILANILIGLIVVFINTLHKQNGCSNPILHWIMNLIPLLTLYLFFLKRELSIRPMNHLSFFQKYRSVIIISGLSIFNLLYSLYFGKGTELGFNLEPITKLELFLDNFTNLLMFAAILLFLYDVFIRSIVFDVNNPIKENIISTTDDVYDIELTPEQLEQIDLSQLDPSQYEIVRDIILPGEEYDKTNDLLDEIINIADTISKDNQDYSKIIEMKNNAKRIKNIIEVRD